MSAIPEFGNCPEVNVIRLAGELWNEFLKVEGLDKNDNLVVNENVHRIQDMMYTNLYIKEHGKIK